MASCGCQDMIALMTGFPKQVDDTATYGTVLYRVNAETALVLGGARALLMQLALPGVAAGVDEHSDFRSPPLPRLWRTLTQTYPLGLRGGAGGRGPAGAPQPPPPPGRRPRRTPPGP